MESLLLFEPFVQSTVKTSFFHLRNIAHLWTMLSFSIAESMINSFIFSSLDYCNALLTGVSKSCINKLQYLQISAARILSGVRVVDHITPVLASLHWLPVSFCVDFTFLMLIYKVLHGLASQYLAELLTPYSPICNWHYLIPEIRIFIFSE